MTIILRVGNQSWQDDKIIRWWQDYDKIMTRLWQDYDKIMTRLWQDYDKIMTRSWQDYDKIMTWLWQDYKNMMILRGGRVAAIRVASADVCVVLFQNCWVALPVVSYDHIWWFDDYNAMMTWWYYDYDIKTSPSRPWSIHSSGSLSHLHGLSTKKSQKTKNKRVNCLCIQSSNARLKENKRTTKNLAEEVSKLPCALF